MISAIAGLLAGSLHVFSGPDHLAAVAPLAVDHQRRAWMTGLRWGVGHAAGVMTVGALSLLLRELLPVEEISDWSERLVGVLLIAIGCWGIRKAMLIHAHEHEHDGHTHVHLHVHSSRSSGEVHKHHHTAFGIGTLHGLAGSSHFLGVLPALAFDNSFEAASYLLAFGLGTIIAMTLFSSAIAAIAARFSLRTAAGYRALMWICSFAAMGVGGYWLLA